MACGWREFADDLAAAGVRRINVSLDSLDRATFARIARGDCLPQVLDGIAAAKDGGHQDQDQHRGAEERQCRRTARPDPLGA